MAKIIDFFDGAQTETVPTIGGIEASELSVYANDAAFEAVNGPGVGGDAYYNSTIDAVRFYNDATASWQTLLSTSTTGINAASIADGSVSNTEFQYINSLTSNAQTQLTQNASDIAQVASDLTSHESDVSAHSASNIVNVPTGNLSANDVQAALDELQSDVDTRIPSSEKGAVNGVASLDGAGKVPVAQLPNSIMEYQGTWNASTNTPTLADGVGNTGDVYRVTVAGSQDLGSGSITFGVGDYAIYNTSGVWEKADTTDAVSSVNGAIGAVTVNAINELTGDVTAGPASGSESKASTIAANAVTFSKIQDINTDRLIGRDTASSGDPEEISVTGGLEFSGSGSIQRSALTGDVTASAGSNSTTIANDAVTNAKLDNMATQTFKGRTTAGTGDPEDLTATQATAMLNTFVGDSGSGGTKGLVTAPATGDATKFLKGDGTWATPTASSIQTAFIKDLQASGTAGQAIANGSYSTSRLNTVEGDVSIVSLSSNQITLTAGTYNIDASMPSALGSGHANTAILFNVTDATTAIVGMPQLESQATTTHLVSRILGRVTIASTKVFEIRQRTNVGSVTQGAPFSIAGQSEVYAVVRIDKL